MSKQPGKPIQHEGRPAQSSLRDGGVMEQDLIMILARTVIERLEEVERESALNSCPDLNDEVRNEERQLLKEIAGFKARLRWIAEGM
ncbi:MAG: hypothetical protein ABRQ26_08060 [Syntrophomonadaceae bacterium]